MLPVTKPDSLKEELKQTIELEIKSKQELPKTPEEIELERRKFEKQHKYENYCINFADRIAMWKEAHRKEPDVAANPPIVWDSKINDYVWMNRQWRRG